jgi:hypothetical protein
MVFCQVLGYSGFSDETTAAAAKASAMCGPPLSDRAVSTDLLLHWLYMLLSCYFILSASRMGQCSWQLITCGVTTSAGLAVLLQSRPEKRSDPHTCPDRSHTPDIRTFVARWAGAIVQTTVSIFLGHIYWCTAHAALKVAFSLTSKALYSTCSLMTRVGSPMFSSLKLQ